MNDKPSEHWLRFIKTLSVLELAKLRHDFKRHNEDRDKEWLIAIDEEFKRREKK